MPPQKRCPPTHEQRQHPATRKRESYSKLTIWAHPPSQTKLTTSTASPGNPMGTGALPQPSVPSKYVGTALLRGFHSNCECGGPPQPLPHRQWKSQRGQRDDCRRNRSAPLAVGVGVQAAATDEDIARMPRQTQAPRAKVGVPHREYPNTNTLGG